MSLFYFRKLNFFPAENGMSRHRFLIVTLPIAVADRPTARVVNGIVIVVLAAMLALVGLVAFSFLAY